MNNSDRPVVVTLPVPQPPMPVRHVIFPKEGQYMLSGDLTPVTQRYKMDTVGMPPSQYQTVRDDISKLASISCTRIALMRRDHAYVGIIDSDDTPHVFVLSSEGLTIKPALDVAKAWVAFDDMMSLERRAALAARRVRADRDLTLYVVDMAKAMIGMSLTYKVASHPSNLNGFHLKHFAKRLSHFSFTAKRQNCPYGGGKECKKHGGDGAKTHKVGYVHANAAYNVKPIEDESDLNDEATVQAHAALTSSKTLAEARLKLKPVMVKHYGFSAKDKNIEQAIDEALEHFRKKGVLINGKSSGATDGSKVKGTVHPTFFCPFGGGADCTAHGGDGAFIHKPGYTHAKSEHESVDLAAFHERVKIAATKAAASGQKAKDFFNAVDDSHGKLAARDLQLINEWANTSSSPGALAIVAAMEHLGIVRNFNNFFSSKLLSTSKHVTPPPDHELTIMAVLARYEYTQAVLRKKFPDGFMPLARGIGEHPVVRQAVQAAEDDAWFKADQNPMTSWADVKKVPEAFSGEIVIEKMMPIENVWVSHLADSRALFGDAEGKNKKSTSEHEHIVISPECTITLQKQNVFFGTSTKEHSIVPSSSKVSGFVPATAAYPSGSTKKKNGDTPGWTVDESRYAGGSQGGMWFKDKNGDHWFGKHYGGDTDRVSGEHLTNELYKLFNIKTPDTEIVNVNGQSFMMSRDVGGTEGSFEKLKGKDSVLNGFVVDAWLANWDVVGLEADNMRVVGGEAYRVDNGGALIWRAQGKPKPFDAVVGEINTMREPDKPAGRVFSALSDADMVKQVQGFVTEYNKNKKQITKLVSQADLSAAAKKAILTGLHDRAEWLEASLPDWEAEVLHAA